MKKLTTLILSFCALISFAQDEILLNQNYSSPLTVNPAFAGSAGEPRLNLNYFNYRPALGFKNMRYTAATDQYIDKIKGGIGLIVSNFIYDDGYYKCNSGALVYSAYIPITDNLIIKPAIQVEFGEKFIDTNMFTQNPYTDDIDGNKRGFFNFFAGFILYSEKYFGGVAVYNITEPLIGFHSKTYSETVLPRRYNIHGGVNLFTESKVKITPTARVEVIEDFVLYRISCTAALNWYRLGLGYERSGIMHYENYHILLGFVHKKIAFGYNYVLYVSQLRNQNIGSHEISFTMLFGKKDKTPEIICPVINGM